MKDEKKNGPISCRHFGDDELAKIKGSYLSLAKELLGDKQLMAGGRKVVTEEDVAVFLMLHSFFTNNMNVEGSLPIAGWREMRKALHEAGDIDRAWCHHRFSRIWNFLDGKDLIAWEDDEFILGVVGEDGRFTPGRASKWFDCEELMRRMAEMEGGEIGGVYGRRGKEDERGERRSILYGCGERERDALVDEGERKSILYGHNGMAEDDPGGEEERKNILIWVHHW